MDAKMPVAVLISMASNLLQFISLILWCIFYSWIITLQDFYSCFRYVIHLLSYLLLVSWKSLSRLSRKTNNVVHEDVSTSKLPPTVELTREDIEIVMERLGLVKERRSQEPLLQESFEIVTMFDKTEPSLDEVREAFRVFDENNDGYIDAMELKKVMSSLGLVGLSEQECQKMIMAFDDDGDGRIDFGEFVKLIEENVT